MEFQEKLSNLDHYYESHFQYYTQSLKVSPIAPFNWKLLIISIVSTKGIRKNLSVLQVGAIFHDNVCHGLVFSKMKLDKLTM